MVMARVCVGAIIIPIIQVRYTLLSEVEVAEVQKQLNLNVRPS